MAGSHGVPTAPAGSQRGLTIALGILVGVLVAGAAIWFGLAVSNSRTAATTPTAAPGVNTAGPGTRALAATTSGVGPGTTAAESTATPLPGAPSTPRAANPGGGASTKGPSGSAAAPPNAATAPPAANATSDVANPFAVPGEAPRVKMY